MPSLYYGTSGSWTQTASSGSYYYDLQQEREERERVSKEQTARVVARDKRERKDRRDRLVIAGMARQQGLQASAALRDRRFRRGKRQIPDWLAQRCRRVFRG